MSHLDTAFKLGAAQAQSDFQAELNKHAEGLVPGRPPAGMGTGNTIGSGGLTGGAGPTKMTAPNVGLGGMRMPGGGGVQLPSQSATPRTPTGAPGGRTFGTGGPTAGVPTAPPAQPAMRAAAPGGAGAAPPPARAAVPSPAAPSARMAAPTAGLPGRV
jgi:hypothetical protein